MKTLTTAKKIFLEWLRKYYDDTEIRFVRKDVIDFITPGGRYIVKRPVKGFIYFTRKQWNNLKDNDMIAVVEDDKVIGVTLFKEARNNRRIKVGDRYYTITLEREDVVMLRIRCSKDTYVRFRKLMTMFTDEEEALKYLLDLHDAYGKMY